MNAPAASEDCGLCRSIEALQRSGGDGYTVARTRTGYVTVFFSQYFKGQTLFVADHHVSELHELEPDVRTLHLDEMARVAEAVYRLHRPRKLNYAVLGNVGPHVHWSIIPRYDDDAEPAKSPWEDPGFWNAMAEPGAQENFPSPTYVEELLSALEATGLTIEQRFPAHGA